MKQDDFEILDAYYDQSLSIVFSELDKMDNDWRFLEIIARWNSGKILSSLKIRWINGNLTQDISPLQHKIERSSTPAWPFLSIPSMIPIISIIPIPIIPKPTQLLLSSR